MLKLEEIDDLCQSGEFGDDILVVNDNVENVMKMYAVFEDVMEDGTNDLQDGDSFAWEVAEEYWYGVQYKDGIPERVKLYQRGRDEHHNNEERVTEIWKWMDEQMVLSRQ